MELIVLTPEKEIFKGAITSVKVPGSNGQFEILKGHAPIVSSLVTGPVRIIGEGGEKKLFTISKGLNSGGQTTKFPYLELYLISPPYCWPNSVKNHCFSFLMISF